MASDATAELGPEAVVRVRETLAWQEVAGELVVLDLDRMVLRGLNRSAARAWGLLDGRRSLAEVAQTLAVRYQMPMERVLADVLAFARDLLARGLLEVPAASGAQPVPRPP